MIKQTITYQCGHTGEVELSNDDIQEKISYLRRNQVCPECFYKYKGYTECPIPNRENLPAEYTEEGVIAAGETDNSHEVDYYQEEHSNELQMITDYNRRPIVDSTYDFEAQVAMEQYANISMTYGDVNIHGYSVLRNKGTKILYLPLRKPWTRFDIVNMFEERYCRYVIIDSKRYFVEADIFSIIGRDEHLSRILLDGEVLSSKDIIALHDPLFDSDRSVIKVCSEKWLECCVLRRVSLNMYRRKASCWTEVLSYLYETILNKNISDCDIAEFENLFKQARSCPRKIYNSERAIKERRKWLESQIKKKHCMIEEQKRLLALEEPLRILVEVLIIKSGVTQMLDASQFPFMQSNYKVKKFILEYENEEIKDLLNKCLYIPEIILDGNCKDHRTGGLFCNILPIDKFHSVFEIPEPRLPYIRSASRGIDLHFNDIKNKLSLLTDKLNSLETELKCLTN